MTEKIIELSVDIYTFLLPLAWLGVAVVILIFLPLSFFQKTKLIAGKGMYYASWLFGTTTWILGCTITLATWGWPAIIIGFLLGGIGVVPIAILASLIELKSFSMSISLIVMVVIVIVTRVRGYSLMMGDDA